MTAIFLLSYLFLVYCSIFPCFATPSYHSTNDLTIHNVTRFKSKHQVENLAIRSNDQILITTTAPSSSVYQIDPLRILDPILVATFPDEKSSSGIVESPNQPDVFYVAVGNLTFNGTAVTAGPAASAIWELDMTSFLAFPNSTVARPATMRLLTQMPSFASINALTSLTLANTSHLLAADSVNGVIWSIPLLSGEVISNTSVAVFLNSTTLQPGSIPGQQGLGVNGVKVFNNSVVYYSNSVRSTFHSIPAGVVNGVISGVGTPSLLANLSTPDDFILDHAGNAYICQQGLDVVSFYNASRPGQSVLPLVKNGSLVGPTAVTWGRGASDRTSLYVTTNGGFTMKPQDQGVSRLDVGDLAQIWR